MMLMAPSAIQIAASFWAFTMAPPVSAPAGGCRAGISSLQCRAGLAL